MFWLLNRFNLKDFPYSRYFFENKLAIPINCRFNIKDIKYILKVSINI